MARNIRTRIERLEKRNAAGGYGFAWITGTETLEERAAKITEANDKAGPDGTTIIFNWEPVPLPPKPGTKVIEWPEGANESKTQTNQA